MRRPLPRAGRGPSTRGAALVEAALLLPVLVTVFGGLLEYGLAWRSAGRLTTGARAAVLDAAREPTRTSADFDVLLRLRTSLAGSSLDTIQYVVVYRTNEPGAPVPAACLAAATAITQGSTGVAGVCNVYSGAFVAAITPSMFTSSTCTDQADRWLCPATRRTVFATSDRLAVAVQMRHAWVSGLVPGGGLVSRDRSAAMLAPVLSAGS